jgi:hypothetical protein
MKRYQNLEQSIMKISKTFKRWKTICKFYSKIIIKIKKIYLDKNKSNKAKQLSQIEENILIIVSKMDSYLSE